MADDVCEGDKLGFEAIRQLHEQIDDDKDGKVDLSESDEVMINKSKHSIPRVIDPRTIATVLNLPYKIIWVCMGGLVDPGGHGPLLRQQISFRPKKRSLFPIT